MSGSPQHSLPRLCNGAKGRPTRKQRKSTPTTSTNKNDTATLTTQWPYHTILLVSSSAINSSLAHLPPLPVPAPWSFNLHLHTINSGHNQQLHSQNHPQAGAASKRCSDPAPSPYTTPQPPPPRWSRLSSPTTPIPPSSSSSSPSTSSLP